MAEADDIRVSIGNIDFDIRVAGVLMVDGKLLVSIEKDGEQTLSGGAVKTGELTEEAVVREFMEETGLAVKVERLLAVEENLFRYSVNDRDYHQVIFVYALTLIDSTADIENLSHEEKLTTCWLNPDEVNQLLPPVLNEIVADYALDKNSTLRHNAIRRL